MNDFQEGLLWGVGALAVLELLGVLGIVLFVWLAIKKEPDYMEEND